MVQEIRRHARIAGLKEAADLDSVERRRLQLWMLTAGLLVAVSLFVTFTAVWESAEVNTIFPKGVLEGSMAALSIGFSAYVFEKERSLRRLTALLVEERVRRETLDRQVARLDSLVRAERAVTATLELERVVDLALDSALSLTGAPSGSVLLEGNQGLRLLAMRGTGAVDVEDAAREVADTRAPRLLSGVGPDSAVRGMAVPLMADRRLAGVLNVYAPEHQEFDEGDLEMLSTFADAAAIAITNSLRFEEERAASSRYRSLEAARQEFAWLAR